MFDKKGVVNMKIELTEKLAKAKDNKLLMFHKHLLSQEEKYEGYDILLAAVENEIYQRGLDTNNQEVA